MQFRRLHSWNKESRADLASASSGSLQDLHNLSWKSPKVVSMVNSLVSEVNKVHHMLKGVANDHHHHLQPD